MTYWLFNKGHISYIPVGKKSHLLSDDRMEVAVRSKSGGLIYRAEKVAGNHSSWPISVNGSHKWENPP